MTSILKGDTSNTITITLASGYDYTGATVHIEFCGVRRSFAGKVAGDSITMNFTSDETGLMPLGAWPVHVTIVKNGLVVTVKNGGVKIRVTDDPAEVYTDGVIAVDAKGCLYGLNDLPASYTDKDVVAKIREILARGGAVLCAAFLCGAAFGASVTGTAKENIRNTDNVVTNVDLSGLATETYVQGAIQESGGMTEQGVRGIVTEMGAQFGKVQSVNGQTGTVNITSVSYANSASYANRAGVSTSAGSATTAGTADNAYRALLLRSALDDAQSGGGRILQSVRPGDGSGSTTNFSGGTSITNTYSSDRFAMGFISQSTNRLMVTMVDSRDAIVGDNIEEVAFLSDVESATPSDYATVRSNANQALAYSQANYQFNHASTNAWFEGTNYNVNAEQSASKVKYSPEAWENVTFTPCSLQLLEIRNGAKQVVWDQRDWTVYYWNFKSAQLSNNLAAVTHDLSENVRTNYMTRGWAKYTAVNGLENPDPSTLVIDTPKVQMFAGHQWEKLVETGGAGYWTLTGNGIELSAADSTNTFLTVKDFEGNACLTFRKTSSYLVYCECGTDITSNYLDNQGRVTFHLATDTQPTAEFSTTLELDSFVEEGESGCPANYEWTGTAGNYDCHFKLKPGITSSSCFARFKVLREGQNVIEHTIPIKLNGGIVFDHNGQSVKIRPTVTSTAVGSSVNWVVAQ